MSTAFVATITSPLSVIKFRLQCQEEMLKTQVLKQKYTGIFNCLSRIIK